MIPSVFKGNLFSRVEIIDTCLVSGLGTHLFLITGDFNDLVLLCPDTSEESIKNTRQRVFLPKAPG